MQGEVYQSKMKSTFTSMRTKLCRKCFKEMSLSSLTPTETILDAQPVQLTPTSVPLQMRNHNESKYGKRSIDPALENQIAQLLRKQTIQRLSAANIHASAGNRLSNASSDALDGSTIGGSSRVSTVTMRNTSGASPMSTGLGSGGQRSTMSQIRHVSTASLFSRSSSQTLASLSFSSPSSSSAAQSQSHVSMSPVKMLATTRFRDRNSKSTDKKRDKENKHRDSFRRLSSSSTGRSSPFPALSLAFGLGTSSAGLASPAVTGSNTPLLGEWLFVLFSVSSHDFTVALYFPTRLLGCLQAVDRIFPRR